VPPMSRHSVYRITQRWQF